MSSHSIVNVFDFDMKVCRVLSNVAFVFRIGLERTGILLGERAEVDVVIIFFHKHSIFHG